MLAVTKYLKINLKRLHIKNGELHFDNEHIGKPKIKVDWKVLFHLFMGLFTFVVLTTLSLIIYGMGVAYLEVFDGAFFQIQMIIMILIVCAYLSMNLVNAGYKNG